jgi:hypothetical protein
MPATVKRFSVWRKDKKLSEHFSVKESREWLKKNIREDEKDTWGLYYIHGTDSIYIIDGSQL